MSTSRMRALPLSRTGISLKIRMRTKLPLIVVGKTLTVIPLSIEVHERACYYTGFSSFLFRGGSNLSV